MVRHLLATLGYRSLKALREAPPGFGNFDGGAGLRTPLELLRHMNRLIDGVRARLTETGRSSADGSWEAEIARFPQLLAELDAVLAAADLPTSLLKRLLQGPLSDAMTHAGQLAMLRRLSGSPIAGENFFEADISSGAFDHR